MIYQIDRKFCLHKTHENLASGHNQLTGGVDQLSDIIEGQERFLRPKMYFLPINSADFFKKDHLKTKKAFETGKYRKIFYSA